MLGRVLVETQQIQRTRMTEYLSSMWNIVDIISLILFIAIIVMRISFYFAFHQFQSLLGETNSPDSTTPNVYNYYKYLETNGITADDTATINQTLAAIEVPTIGSYSENDLLAVINIIYSINSIIACTRLLPLFEASYSLGPLQLTMGGMLADLAKVMCLLLTVILAFSLGTAKLYNSRFFYLYVDGDDGGAADKNNYTLRSINCLYSVDQTNIDQNVIGDCGFNHGFIDPMLFQR